MSEKISEGSVPVHELKTPTMLSIRRFLKSVFVIILSLVCVFVGILIYHLHTPIEKTPVKQATYHPSVQHNFKVNRTPVFPSVTSNLPVDSEESFTDLPISEETDVSADAPATIRPEPSRELSETTIVEPVKTEFVKNPAIMAEPVALKSTISLTDALSLRDHLLTGDSCLADLQIIMKSEIPNAREKEELVDRLMPICTSRSAFKDLQILFNKNRKSALMTYYRLNNPSWLAYLKAFGTSLVDIRRIHPLKKRAKDIIFQAQDAMVQKRIGLAVHYVKELPPAIQADFYEFMGLAESYLSAQKAAEKLVLSFDGKGERK